MLVVPAEHHLTLYFPQVSESLRLSKLWFHAYLQLSRKLSAILQAYAARQTQRCPAEVQFPKQAAESAKSAHCQANGKQKRECTYFCVTCFQKVDWLSETWNDSHLCTRLQQAQQGVSCQLHLNCLQLPKIQLTRSMPRGHSRARWTIGQSEHRFHQRS